MPFFLFFNFITLLVTSKEADQARTLLTFALCTQF